MYFLQQLKQQFLLTLSLSVGHEGHALDDFADQAPVDTTVAPENQEDFTQEQISNMSSSEILHELKERLDAVKAGEKIVGTRADVLMRFCIKVKNNEVHGYSTADADYKRLVEMVQLAVIEYRSLAGEAGEIDQKIRQELDRITLGINREIVNPDGNTVALGIEEMQQQQELSRLETEKNAHLGTMRGLVRDFENESGRELSASTLTFIQRNITQFDGEYPEEDMSQQDKIDYLNDTIIPSLLELTLQLQIRLRDEKLRVDDESLGEGRNRGVGERYNEIIENLTDVQREIIDGRTFEELDVADFQSLWLDGGVNITNLFLHNINDEEITGTIGEELIVSFGSSAIVDDLFPSLIPLDVSSVVIDGRVAHRVSDTRFEYEGGLLARVRDGSSVIIQSRENLTEQEVQARRESFEEVFQSNRGRQELQQQVSSGLQGIGTLAPSERGEESTIDFLKRIINQIAVAFGFGEIFDMYSEEDLAAIAESGGMQRFIPNNAEILRDAEFMAELQNMCGRLGVQRDHMLVVMQAECGLNPTAVNPTSGASGLIQFMPATARGLGTTVEAIRQMSATQQLEYVEKYFENYRGRMHSVEDIYRVVFYPAAIGKPDNWVFGSQNNSAQRVAQQNSGIARHSTRSDGLIDNTAFARYVQAKVGQFMTTDYSQSSVSGGNIEGLSAETLQSLPEKRRKIVSKGLDAYRRGDILGAAHCTDWVDKIYQSETGTSVHNMGKLFEGGINTVTPTDSRDTGLRTREYAGNGIISQVQAGDHIVVDHGPEYGRGRTHSVIALESPTDGILRVVSYPNGGRSPRIDTYDLTGQGRNGTSPEKAMRIHSAG